MKVSIIEILQNEESIGYMPLIKKDGKSPLVGIIENNLTKTFKTRKEALQYGREFVKQIKPSVKSEQNI